MANDRQSIEDGIIEDAKRRVDKYLASDEFRREVKNETDTQLRGLIEDTEGRARKWAAIAAGLIFAFFFVLLSIQYAQIREKEADIAEQYIKSTDLIEKIRSTVDGLEKDTVPKAQTLQTQIATTEKEVNSTIARVKAAEKAAEEDAKSTITRVKAVTDASERGIADIKRALDRLRESSQNLSSQVESLADRVTELEKHVPQVRESPDDKAPSPRKPNH
jgi:outer membrane murein-binding lipoprotein Lpp